MKANEFIKDSKVEFALNEVVVNGSNDKEYKIKISNKLKDTDIMKMVDDILARSEMCKNENVKFDVVMSMYALMIKYFTDIEFSTYPNAKKQFSHELDVLSALIDLGVFEQIIKHFNQDEVKKIQDAFSKYAESFKYINDNVIAQEILGGDKDVELSI